MTEGGLFSGRATLRTRVINLSFMVEPDSCDRIEYTRIFGSERGFQAIALCSQVVMKMLFHSLSVANSCNLTRRNKIINCTVNHQPQLRNELALRVVFYICPDYGHGHR